MSRKCKENLIPSEARTNNRNCAVLVEDFQLNVAKTISEWCSPKHWSPVAGPLGALGEPLELDPVPAGGVPGAPGHQPHHRHQHRVRHHQPRHHAAGHAPRPALAQPAVRQPLQRRLLHRFSQSRRRPLLGPSPAWKLLLLLLNLRLKTLCSPTRPSLKTFASAT